MKTWPSRTWMLAFSSLGLLSAAHAAPALVPGLALGGQAGYYRYSENPRYMKLASQQAYGLTGSYQYPWSGHAGLRFEGRAFNARADYDSNGTGFSKNETNWLAEIRGLITTDWDFGAFSLAPYTGYGYRYLRNDGKVTNTGAQPYTRESQYHYLPVGAYARVAAGPGDVVAQLEYAQLLRGYQYSAIGSGINNTQSSGHHWRAMAGYQWGNWQAGPYAQFWRVGNSSTNCNTTGTCGYEPKNFTREAGIQFTYHFGGGR